MGQMQCQAQNRDIGETCRRIEKGPACADPISFLPVGLGRLIGQNLRNEITRVNRVFSQKKPRQVGRGQSDREVSINARGGGVRG